MIRFLPQPEPPMFDQKCRQKGRRWLETHPAYDRPSDYWSEFEPDLRNAFAGLCAYCVMSVMRGQTDHFIPISVLKKKQQDHLAYEWSNFRYIEGVLNQRKGESFVLDPFKVRDTWFELKLPSLQVVLTDKVPQTIRKKAEFTLNRLGLTNDAVIIRFRQKWFELYRSRKLTLDGLKDVAPQIARAVEADLQKGKDWRFPES